MNTTNMVHFEEGENVVLSESGKECWRRNQQTKNIAPHQIMVIVQLLSYDSGIGIYEVAFDGERDNYYENHLVRVDK